MSKEIVLFKTALLWVRGDWHSKDENVYLPNGKALSRKTLLLHPLYPTT